MSESTVEVWNIILGKPLPIITRRCNKNDNFDNNNKNDNNDNFLGLKDDDNEEIKDITP